MSWDETSKAVLERDGKKCFKCAVRKALHVHHLIPKEQGGSDDPLNLITLCSRHHRIAETNYMKYGATNYWHMMKNAAEWRTLNA